MKTRQARRLHDATRRTLDRARRHFCGLIVRVGMKRLKKPESKTMLLQRAALFAVEHGLWKGHANSAQWSILRRLARFDGADDTPKWWHWVHKNGLSRCRQQWAFTKVA